MSVILRSTGKNLLDDSLQQDLLEYKNTCDISFYYKSSISIFIVQNSRSSTKPLTDRLGAYRSILRILVNIKS